MESTLYIDYIQIDFSLESTYTVGKPKTLKTLISLLYLQQYVLDCLDDALSGPGDLNMSFFKFLRTILHNKKAPEHCPGLCILFGYRHRVSVWTFSGANTTHPENTALQSPPMPVWPSCQDSSVSVLRVPIQQ